MPDTFPRERNEKPPPRLGKGISQPFPPHSTTLSIQSPFPRIIQARETRGALAQSKAAASSTHRLSRGILRLIPGESEQPPGGSNVTNAWHMFALSPSPRGEVWSRLNIAECVSRGIYAPGGKVTARCAAGRCSATPASRGAHSQGSVSQNEASPRCGKQQDLWGCGCRVGREMLDVVLEEAGTEGRGAAAPQAHTAGPSRAVLGIPGTARHGSSRLCPG